MIKNKTNKTNVNIVNTLKISDYTICRWSALQDAMDLISEKCQEKNIDFNTVELKPLEILKYIDNSSDVIYNKNFPNDKIDIKQVEYNEDYKY